MTDRAYWQDKLDRFRNDGSCEKTILDALLPPSPDTASTSLVLGGNGSYSASGEAAADAATEGWRDIESAPREPVAEGWRRGPLVYLKPTWGGWGVGFWWIDETDTENGGCFRFCGDDGPDDEQPTHWMPLPNPSPSDGALPRHGKPLSDTTFDPQSIAADVAARYPNILRRLAEVEAEEAPTVLQVACLSVGGAIVTLPRPARHSDVMHLMAFRPGPEAQGFLLSDGSFADREEAYRIARAAGQPWLRDPAIISEHLFTEDLW